MDLGLIWPHTLRCPLNKYYRPTVWQAQNKISALVEVTILQGEPDKHNVVNYTAS